MIGFPLTQEGGDHDYVPIHVVNRRLFWGWAKKVAGGDEGRNKHPRPSTIEDRRKAWPPSNVKYVVVRERLNAIKIEPDPFFFFFGLEAFAGAVMARGVFSSTQLRDDDRRHDLLP